MHFVDQVDLVAADASARSARCRGSRACCRRPCSMPRRAPADRRSGPRRCRRRRRTSPQGVAVTPLVMQLRLFASSRAIVVLPTPRVPVRRYAWCSRLLVERIGERRDNVLLPDELGERLRPPFPGENLVAHACRLPDVLRLRYGCARMRRRTICRQIGLQRGGQTVLTRHRRRRKAILRPVGLQARRATRPHSTPKAERRSYFATCRASGEARAGEDAQRTRNVRERPRRRSNEASSRTGAKELGGEPDPRHLRLVAVAASFRT